MSSVVNKLANAAERESSEAQALIAVKKLEEAALELIASYEDCACYVEAIREVPRAYRPSNQRTNFEKLIEAEINKVKGASSTSVENHPLIRQFREAVWVEIEELRSSGPSAPNAENIEDLADDEDDNNE
ncbi:hypothetical protein E2562_031016 [Oryza meyeriana var. granulata]|uniref:Uncharacterized protein n=1 Tax=Oryza meyeriana var. granulata TaxID=110450 RepID=A0A6G1ERD6_9ORYZ|nr:hypothetical protein E2562_031016 [Oryza meyeriana var. granulata]